MSSLRPSLDESTRACVHDVGNRNVRSEACLASVTAVNATAKTKVITLHDPEIPVQLSFSGTMCVVFFSLLLFTFD